MNCADFELELEQQLDRRIIDDNNRLREHRRDCAICREAWARTRLLAEAIVAWREQIPDVDLAPAVVARLSVPDEGTLRKPALNLSEGPSPSSRGPLDGKPAPVTESLRHSRRALAAVIAGLAALVAVSSFVPFGAPERQQTASVVRPATPATESGPNVASSDAESLSAAESAYTSLATSAAGALREFALLMGQPSTAPGPQDSPEPSGEQWIDGLQHRLRPIGRSLEDAFDFLWEVGDPSRNSRI